MNFTRPAGLALSEWTSPFDFFLGVHIPALDGFLSQTDQSIFLELTFWCCAYLLYGAVVSEWVRSAWQKTSYWDFFKTKFGVFCWNAQDDVVLMNMLGMHHTLAGGMCLYGAYTGDMNLWRHGGMLEVGFEIADVLSMNPIFPMFPYNHGNLKLDAYVALLFHHIPCVFNGVLAFHHGMHFNPHCHMIIFLTLIGAAMSAFGAIFVVSRDLDTQIVQATAPLVLNIGFWYYCRFHELQKEAYALIDDVENNPDLEGTIYKRTLVPCLLLLTVFNTIVLVDGGARAFRYTMRCFDGVTIVERGEVPLSREDRWKKEGKLESKKTN